MSDAVNHDPPETPQPADASAPTPSPTPPMADSRPKALPPSLLEIGRRRLSQLRNLLDSQRGTADLTVDFVHDLRVVTRRLSEVVGVVEGLLQPAVAEALTAVLRQTRRAAGDLRDLDVLGEHLERWRFPAGLKTVRQRLLDAIPERRRALVKQQQLQLDGTTLAEALLVLARTLENPAAGQVAEVKKRDKVLRKRLRQRSRQLERAFGKAALKQTSGALHQARIAAKKYRYTLELAAEYGLGKGGRTLKFLKKTQSHLGTMHDTDVILETVRQRLTDPPLPTLDAGGSAKLTARICAQARVARLHQNQAWRKFQKALAALQGRRAAEFFASSYQWMNEKC